jgi:hypothetical protein
VVQRRANGLLHHVSKPIQDLVCSAFLKTGPKQGSRGQGYMLDPDVPGFSPDIPEAMPPDSGTLGSGAAMGPAWAGAGAGAGRGGDARRGAAFFATFLTGFLATAADFFWAFAGFFAAFTGFAFLTTFAALFRFAPAFFAFPLAFAAGLERAETLRAAELRALAFGRAGLFFFAFFFAICDVPPGEICKPIWDLV